MFKYYLRAMPMVLAITFFVYGMSYVYHQNDPGKVTTGLADIYIKSHGMEVAGSGAVIIAKSGSTVVLYKEASLIETTYDRISTRTDFALNFDNHFAITYNSDTALPAVWASRTIAQKGSLIMAGAGARVLAEDGAKIIHKNKEAPDFLWDSQIDARETYARALHELG